MFTDEQSETLEEQNQMFLSPVWNCYWSKNMKENILYTVEILISVSCTIIYEYVLYVNIQKQDFTVVDSQLHVVFWVQLQFNQTFMKNDSYQ